MLISNSELEGQLKLETDKNEQNKKDLYALVTCRKRLIREVDQLKINL